MWIIKSLTSGNSSKNAIKGNLTAFRYTKIFGDLTILSNQNWCESVWFQPKLRYWKSKIELSGFESCWRLVVKLFLSNWDDTQTWFHWLPAQVAPPGMLPACWKNNRVEKSVVQIITKNSYQKWLVKMVKSPKLVSSPKKFSFGLYNQVFLLKCISPLTFKFGNPAILTVVIG